MSAPLLPILGEVLGQQCLSCLQLPKVKVQYEHNNGIAGQDSSVFLSLLMESLRVVLAPLDAKFSSAEDMSLVSEHRGGEDNSINYPKDERTLENANNTYITRLVTMMTELVGNNGQLDKEKAVIEELQPPDPIGLVRSKPGKSSIQNTQTDCFSDEAFLYTQGINKSELRYSEIADLHCISSNSFEFIDDASNSFKKYDNLFSDQSNVAESEIPPFPGNRTARIVNGSFLADQLSKRGESIVISDDVESKPQFSTKEVTNHIILDQLTDPKPVSLCKEKHEVLPVIESHSLNTLDNFSKVASITDDGRSFIVALEPEGLGKLNIQLSLDHGFINVKIDVSSSYTKSLIENNIHYIVDLLLRDGLNIGGLSVNLENNNRWSWGDAGQRSAKSSKPGLNVNTINKLYLAKALNHGHITEGVISIFV